MSRKNKTKPSEPGKPSVNNTKGWTFVPNTDEDKEKEDKKDDAPPVSFLKLYAYASTRDKICIAFGLVGACVTGCTTPVNTLIFGNLIESMVSQASNLAQRYYSNRQLDDAFTEIFLDQVTWFAIYSCILGVVMLAGTYVSIMLFNFAAHSQIFRIRGNFLRSVLNQDIAWYDVNQSGEFASRMNEDLTKLEDGLGEKVVMFAHFMVAFIGSIILALVRGWQLALVCMASLPVTFIVVGIVAMITGKLAKKEMSAYAKAGAVAEEVFGAIRTVVGFGGQEKEGERYANNLIDARKINIKKGFFAGLGFGLLWFFIYATYALAFWYGVGLVIDHRYLPPEEAVYDAGTMFTVFFSVMMGAMSLGASSPFIESFGIAKGAAAKVFQIIETKPIIDPLANTGEVPQKCDGNLTLRNVFFNYPGRPDVKILQGVNLSINKGETVALVGSSGCGKSTCIQLIQRFYDPAQGEVLLDNRNMRDLNVSWLRQKIGVVGQEPVLFGTTILENIRYGHENATAQEIEDAAKAANAHNFIQRLPEGYHTLVGERGAQLSGGQKQRVAIARALVRNPDILLLDEATSALDTASEAKVQAALETASKGRTTVIVAHRLSTIRNADKIVVLKDGFVVEEGAHADLMKLGGHYHALVTAQMGNVERDGEMTESKFVVQDYDEDAKEADVIAQEDETLKSAGPSISMWEVVQWNKQEWPYITIGSVCSVLMGAAMPLFAILFGEIVQVLSLPDSDQVRDEANMYSLYFVLVGILVGGATFFQIWTYGIAGEYLTERVRDKAFKHMLKQEMAWFDDKTNGTGTLCARLSTDASAVQGATGQRIGTVLSSVSTLILGIGIAMYYEWRLGFVALAFAPIILVASYMDIKLMGQQNLGNGKALEKSTKIAVEVVSNIRTVVSLGREKMFFNMYMDLLEPSVKSAKRNTHMRGLVYGIARSIWFFAYAACMVYGAQLVVWGEINIATVFVVTQALIMGSVSIANSLAYAPNFQKGMVAAGKVKQLLERQPKIQDPQPIMGSNKQWDVSGDVAFDKTQFFYPSRPSSQILQGLNLDVRAGQTVALVGASGCGKSTCIQLLLRYYDATDGFVSIDQKDVTSVPLSSLRSQLGTVSQEPSLFDRTIAENVAYGDNSREISKEEVIDAAKQANIHNFVVSLPLGYDTRLGNKGTQLSGGQKQRIAIARALIRKPKILLLDEATSALDMESEKVVQAALDAASEGRTCITIAHRLSTIVDADIIFVINMGRVVERGTHKELLNLRGFYHSLYTLQTGVK
ncbi:ATP-dependent translocase ABCB1-like isoform X2 [Bradysia coprophila]|uniref:ATP-dependent translocase ABCB1-like isoform X2 n=1 Tax=Bradysia coprophila TaxID=38358 RepID=UPI00187DAA77|nr:ATP-dependent translocase ABCB1-like isoform X2 [Bradysia coprophila]